MAKTKVSKGVGRKARRATYWANNTRNINKANKLAKRWKYYKIQPPKALNGLSDDLIVHGDVYTNFANTTGLNIKLEELQELGQIQGEIKSISDR